MTKRGMCWIIIISFVLLLAIQPVFSVSQSNFIMLGYLPHNSIGDIDISWKDDNNSFVIVGGDDSFSKTPAYQVHTRFILESNGNGLINLEFTNVTIPKYQRYTSIAWCPNSKYALITDINGTLWKLTNNKLENVTNGINPIEPLWDIIWEPTGKYALIGSGQSIYKYNGTTINKLDTQRHGFYSASWEPNGRYVLLAGPYKDEIGFYDGNIFKTISTLTTGLRNYSVHNVGFSPVNELALISMQNQSIIGPYGALVTFNGNEFKLIKCPILSGIGEIAWNPNGSFAYLNKDLTSNRTMIYSNGIIQNIYIGLDGTLLGWSPAGDYLIFIRSKNNNIEVWKYFTNNNIVSDDFGAILIATVIISVIIIVSLIAAIIIKRRNRKQPPNTI